MWSILFTIIGGLLFAFAAPRPKTRIEKIAKRPTVEDGRRKNKVYGTVWIDNLQCNAFKQVRIGEDKIKAKGGKK